VRLIRLDEGDRLVGLECIIAEGVVETDGDAVDGGGADVDAANGDTADGDVAGSAEGDAPTE
jgi:hypothetical protein